MSIVTKASSRFFYGWVIVIAMLVASAVLLGTRQSYGVFFKSIQDDFQLSRAETSGVFSAYMAFSAVCAVLGGWALDKFGPKRTMAVMGLATGISLLLSSQVHALWQLYLTYSLILAIGTGETYTVVSAAVSRWFIKRRGLALGISQAGGGVGLLILAPFASYLILSFDWRIAYIVMGVIALVLVVGPAMLLKGSPGEIGILPDGALPSSSQNREPGPPKKLQLTGLTMKETIRTKQFWIIFLVWLLQGTASYIVTTQIVPHATDLGISTISAATILSVFAIFNILGGLIAGTLSDIISRKAVSIICALIGAGAMFWLVWIPSNVGLFYIFAALFGIPFGGISILISAMAGDIFGLRSIGTIMGWIGIAWFAGAAVGPLIGGAIFDAYQSYVWAFLIGAICMLAVIGLLAVLSNPRFVHRSN